MALNRSDAVRSAWKGRAALAALALVSLLCLLFFNRYRTAAFPEHAVRFSVDRAQATARAQAFLRDTLKQDVQGYMVVTTFETDERAKTYLEKQVGVARTTAIAAQSDLWHFRSRYFRPLLHEEYQVSVVPDGRVVGYLHLIDDTLPGAHLTRDQALGRAEAFRQDVVKPPGDWSLAQDVSTEQPGRRDWHFEWIRRDFRITPSGQSGQDQGWERLDLDVQGDQLGGFQQSVGVPESWSRQYDRIRSANDLLAGLDSALGFLPLTIAALIVVARGFARHTWRPRAPGWLALVGGLLTVAASLNGLPLAIAGYSKSVSWSGFLIQLVAGAFLSGVGQGVIIFLFAVAGDLLYSVRFPSHLSLAASFTWRGAMSRPSARALAVGALLATVMAAYQIVYYVAGRRVGIWTPADLPYTNLYSAVAPWLYPVSTGYSAATFEEFAFRMFAIPLLLGLLLRATRSVRLATALAILLSAVVWALLHSTYPQDPFFARGLELTLAGCVFGWLMVRYGILASFAVHYCFDAFLSAAALGNVQSLPASAAADALAFLPLLLAAIAALRAALRGGFVNAAPLLNEAQRPAQPPERTLPAPTLPWRYRGLPAPVRGLAVVLGGLGLIGLLVAHAAVGRPFRLDRQQAGVAADAALAQAGINPSGYRRILTLESQADPPAAAYLRDHGGSQVVQAVYGDFIPPLLWQARYVRPLQRDEYRLQLRPEAAPGSAPFSLTLDLAPSSAVARLAQPEALRRAEAALAAQPGWAGGDHTLIETNTSVELRRTDYYFVFQRSDVRYGEATLRADLNVIGDCVTGYHPFVNLSAQARFVYSRTDARQIVAGLLFAAAALALIGLAIAAFLQLARARVLLVRPALLVGAGFAFLATLDELNALPVLYRGYQTALSPQTFLASAVAGKAALELVSSLLAAYVTALLAGLWRTQVVPTLLPWGNRRRWTLDTALLALVLPLATLGVVPAIQAMGSSGGTLPPLGGAMPMPVGAEDYVPALAALAQVRWAVLAVALVMVTYLLLRRALERDRWALLLCLLLPLLAAMAARSGADAAAVALAGVAAILLLAGVARLFLRANLPAYLGVTAVLALLVAAQSELRTASTWLVANGVAVVALTLAGPAVFVMALGRRPDPPVGSAEELAAASSEPVDRPLDLVVEQTQRMAGEERGQSASQCH